MNQPQPIPSADTVAQAMSESARLRRQAVLKLKREERLTYQQIAEQIGVSKQRVHAMCKRALKETLILAPAVAHQTTPTDRARARRTAAQ